MSRIAAALLALFVVSSSASAQIVFEPVKYQHLQGKFGYVYYYGGADASMKRFIKGDTNVNPHQIVTQDFRVYSDNIPRLNASWQGYVAGDAYNEANGNLPGYFRKSDVIRSGQPDSSGAWVVPPVAQNNSTSPGTIDIKPYVRPQQQSHPVFVFPKDLLDKPLPKPDEGRKVVSI